jgi:hypothetical protein
MKTSIATIALAAAVCLPASAQQAMPPRRGTIPPAAPAPARPLPTFSPTPGSAPSPAPTPASTGGQPTKVDPNLYRSGDEIPAPTVVAPAEPFMAPEGPYDQFLVQKENGPFMVAAQTFRGPDAPKYALALVQELRNSFGLPAYIFYLRIKPGNSNIRRILPTAEPYAANRPLGAPERYRSYDEAVVLVGNYKTTDEALKALHRIKNLHPKCLDKMPKLSFHHGDGLKRATYTVNPLLPAQMLYPGREIAVHHGQEFDPSMAIKRMAGVRKADAFVERLNSGSYSLYHCPGPVTLQVAEFTGRATLNTKDSRFSNPKFLGLSPLGRAGDDAEKLANALAKNPLTKGHRPYVYHDRSVSKVTLGAFRSLDDPALIALQNELYKVSIKLMLDKETNLCLIPQPILIGTPEGARIYDTMVQKTSGSALELIPLPSRR